MDCSVASSIRVLLAEIVSERDCGTRTPRASVADRDARRRFAGAVLHRDAARTAGLVASAEPSIWKGLSPCPRPWLESRSCRDENHRPNGARRDRPNLARAQQHRRPKWRLTPHATAASGRADVSRPPVSRSDDRSFSGCARNSPRLTSRRTQPPWAPTAASETTAQHEGSAPAADATARRLAER